LPTAELEQTLTQFLAPLLDVLPDARLRRVLPLAVQGILASQSPLITRMAQPTSRRRTPTVSAAAKRIYRLLANPRVSARRLTHGLYRLAQAIVAAEAPPYLVVALDPVQFEKPYTRKLPGVSMVHKSTPPDRYGQARLTPGYPALTATIVNTRVPATTYARWFSYKTEFLSQNLELRHALRMTRHLFPRQRLRFVGDAGLDVLDLFTALNEVQGEWVIRAHHLERWVEVYNDRLDRWERERLQDLVDTVPWRCSWEVSFTHAGKTRLAKVRLAWLRLRLGISDHLEETARPAVWALIVYDPVLERTLVLLTNVPLVDEAVAQSVYNDWRLRGRIEHGYRFDQEQGLDVEDMRVRSLERQQMVFVLVLAAAQVVFQVGESWPPQAVEWLRRLGGKLGWAIDRDGPYILLHGLAAVWQAVAAFTQAERQPFPHHLFPGQGCG
jgi:hypothetical protein